MMQMLFSRALVLFAGAAHAGRGPEPAELFCSVEPRLEESDAARTRRIVRNAEVVVRAVAVGSATGRALKPWDGDTLAFAVREVLKGSGVPDTLRFYGVVADWDDFQDGPVPYFSHRFRYAAGSCINAFYKLGAEYLLLLGRRPEIPGLSPYWQILAPTNEQLRGPDDPWLRWVKQRLAAPPANRARTRRRGASPPARPASRAGG